MTDPGQSDKNPNLAISHSPAEKTEQHLVSKSTQPPPPVARIQHPQESRELFLDPLIPDYRLQLVPRAEREAGMENPGNCTIKGLLPAAATMPTQSSHSEARGNPSLWITTNTSDCQELRDSPQLPILDTRGATATSSQSKLKGSRKLPLGGPRIIPFRSSSYQVELVKTRASQIEIQNISQTCHHISTDISQEKLVAGNIHRQSTPQAGPTMNVTEEHIDINIKAHHERDPAESASIPTITITGLDLDPQFLRGSIRSPMESRKDGKDMTADRDGTPPIPSSQGSEQALCDESMAGWEQGTTTSSLPTTPRSGSQSSEPAHKIHGIDTTSTGHAMLVANSPPVTLHTQGGGPYKVTRQSPQNVPVRRAGGELEGLGATTSPPYHHHKASQGQNTEAKVHETNDANLSHHRGSNKAHVADQCQVPADHNETLIQEAARIAMQRSRAKEIVTTRSHTPSPRTQGAQEIIPTIQTLPGPKDNRSHGNADTDLSVIRISFVNGKPTSRSQAKEPSKNVKDTKEAETGAGKNTKTSMAVTLVSSLLTVCMIWLSLACAWWVIVKPAFDQRSHLWRRKRRRESTWEDVCVFAAAGVFFVVCALLLAGSVRTGFWAVMRI